MEKLFKVSVVDDESKETLATIHVAKSKEDAKMKAISWMINQGASDRLYTKDKYVFRLEGNKIIVESAREKHSADLQVEEILPGENGDFEITI